MKKVTLKLICCFCAVFIILNSFLMFNFDKTSAKAPVGKMSSVYGYILNDYMLRYGVLSTAADGTVVSGNGSENPEGVIYGDLMYFDGNEYPYLVIFSADGTARTVTCSIWSYGDEYENADCIAEITKSCAALPENQIGEFNIGWTNDKRYITYNIYEDYSLVSSEFYTVINDEAFMYISNPADVTTAGVADFNATYFHTGINSADYNQALDEFFSTLKSAAADSVTYENIANRVSDDDSTALSRVLIRAALHSDFDIANYETIDDYEAALAQATAFDTFSRLDALYNLGDGIYYAMFDTTRSTYNYALLRKSDDAKNGYQILKVNTDCIPLADKELKDIKLVYMSNPLLYAMSQDEPELDNSGLNSESAVITVKVGDSPSVIVNDESDTSSLLSWIRSFKSSGASNASGATGAYGTSNASGVYDAIKFPAACIGGGISIALLTILWIYLYAEN